jgi:hypothetical protein
VVLHLFGGVAVVDVWLRGSLSARSANGGAQIAFIPFSTFLDLRPVSAANDLQTSINGRLAIRISKSKTPV